jgi:SAM-dependent methyltransferase
MTNNSCRFVQFGCGNSCPQGWANFDVSPMLRLRVLPIVGRIAVARLSGFPGQVMFGDIVSGLPVSPNSVEAVFSAHVIEHLHREDVPRALQNVHRILAPGGIFRSVLPDISKLARSYLSDPDDEAGIRFVGSTLLTRSERAKGVMGIARSILGHSNHQWMWDFKGLRLELIRAGFGDVREAAMGDSAIPEMRAVESPSHFEYAFCFEARKPH